MTDFSPKYISFDCYGTLINWQITPVTRELVGDQLSENDWPEFLRQFGKYRLDQVCGTYYPYRQVLEDAFTRVCKRWGIEAAPDAGQRLGDAVLSWGPHADVPAPLAAMAQHFPLVILSNADDAFLDVSAPKLGAPFHAVYTAEQAGVYKPRYQAFEYMLDTLNASPSDFVHVTSHTRYDIMPAHDLGFDNLVFLDRGFDPLVPAYGYTKVDSLDELNKLLGIA
ncbi:haloacid dehalogenase type II [Prauserella alba]|uniref:Haloacid dehalogenase type II n=2 Tax=Prauserella alba TaxID=176898 RepID=A0ABP4G4F4_9PSEU